MTFTILSVRTGDEADSPLYPQPGESPNSVELEDADGAGQTYAATAVVVRALDANGGRRNIGAFREIEAGVIVTDARIAIACSKYDKGGGWTPFSITGLVVATTANTVSKARARRRRRGKMLVGHVRYQWVRSIEAKDRTGLLTSNVLKVVVDDPTTDGAVELEITFHKRQPASQVASEVERRRARHLIDPATAGMG